MKIEVNKLRPSKQTQFKEDVTFDSEKYNLLFPLQEIKVAHVEANVAKYDDFINVDLKITAEVTLICSYSLKPFPSKLRAEDELHFASYIDEDDYELLDYKGSVIDLDPYIFDLISASVPLKPKAPGAKLPESGKGYRVMTEDEERQEKSEKGNGKFDALLDLDLDD